MLLQIVILAVLCSVSMSFAPTRFLGKPISSNKLSMSVFDNAVKDWADTYPSAYNAGWGPTTLAERWFENIQLFQ